MTLFCRFLTSPCLLLLACLVRVQAAPAITIHPLTAPGPAAYGQAEWAVTLDQSYVNPFDPDEIAVDAVFTGPKGQTLRVPGFWFQDFRRQKNADGTETLMAQGAPEWRLRFCPPTPGRWRIAVTARDHSGLSISPPLPFAVLPSHAAGFVRRTPGNTRTLQYDNGSPYFLVGENVGWAGKAGLGDYETWFPSLSKAGGNYVRVWLANRPLEHGPNGLGRYDLANAWYFDQVLALADRNGINCMLALGTYGEFTTGGFFNEGQWPVNPYNKANGGPAATPADFWTDPTARAFSRRRLRYLIARYGAQTSLAFWELWNETDAPVPWLREMSGYLKAHDAYKHLVTNSYSTVGTADAWNLPDMDLTQTHRYGDEGSLKDVAPVILADARQHDAYSKPHLMGEFGISWRNSDAKFDPEGLATNLHNGLWAGALSGDVGGASIWWWDNYVHPQHLYSQLTGLAKFAATVDWPRRLFRPLDLPPPTRTSSGPETFGDLVLNPTGVWGDKAVRPVIVRPDGGVSGGPLLSILYGPAKPEMRSVLTLHVTLPHPGTLVAHVGTVSNLSRLKITLDGKAVGDFPFNAAPGKGEGYQSTKAYPEYGGIYQALFNVDRIVPLPAGPHVLTLENTEGDWLALGSLTLTHALSSRYSLLRTAALQDPFSGETLAWLQDPASNWDNDRAGLTPQAQVGVRLSLPVPRLGAYQVTWWDTRRGVPFQTQRLRAVGDRLILSVPTFTRDVALRVVRP